MKYRLIVLSVLTISLVSCKSLFKKEVKIDFETLSKEVIAGKPMDELSYTHGLATSRALKSEQLTTIDIKDFEKNVATFRDSSKKMMDKAAAQKSIQEILQRNQGFKNLTGDDKKNFEIGVAVLFYEGFIKDPAFPNLNFDQYKKGLNEGWNADTVSNEDSLRTRYLKFKTDFNKELGQLFLQKNKTRDSVQVTPSGLQYKVLKAGEGEKPKASNNVTVHYEGRLINGNIFDSSYKRGKTASFGLGQVIKGWTEGLQLMSPGAKYRFYIPYELAYGERGTRGIPGYSMLIFDVELFSFK